MAPVRELEHGDRPRDWMTSEPASANASVNLNGNTDALAASAKNAEEPGQNAEEPTQEATHPEQPEPAPARITPQRYAVQFTANEEYVKLVEEAKALLSHSDPRLVLDELHLRAMSAFVVSSSAASTPYRSDLENRRRTLPTSSPSPEPDLAELESAPPSKDEPAVPRRRGRYIPARVRRAVFERDGRRCTFVDSSVERCRETHLLEFHHLHAFARRGASTEGNLTLRCRAHNARAAEDDFGKEFVEGARTSPHEPWPK